MAPGLRPRFIWLFWLAAATTLVVFTCTPGGSLSAAATLDRRSAGWKPGGATAGSRYARARGAGRSRQRSASAGNRLLAFDGDANVARAGASRHRIASLQAGVGNRYTVAIERKGDAREHALVVAPETGQVLVRLSWFVVSLVWCGIGVFMGLVQPERRMAQLAFLAAMAVGFVFIQVGVLQLGFWLWQPAHMVLGYHFFYRFPGGVPPSTPWTALLCVLYAACTLPIVTGWIISTVSLTQGPGAAARGWRTISRS